MALKRNCLRSWSFFQILTRLFDDFTVKWLECRSSCLETRKTWRVPTKWRFCLLNPIETTAKYMGVSGSRDGTIEIYDMLPGNAVYQVLRLPPVPRVPKKVSGQVSYEKSKITSVISLDLPRVRVSDTSRILSNSMENDNPKNWTGAFFFDRFF